MADADATVAEEVGRLNVQRRAGPLALIDFPTLSLAVLICAR